MPVVTPRNFRDALFGALNTFWAARTPIAWPNVAFDPKALDAYLEVQLIGAAEDGQVPRGHSVLQQPVSRSGTVVLSLYVRQDDKKATDQLYDLTAAALAFLSNPRAIANTLINGIGQQEVGPDGTFYQLNVSGTYTYFADQN